MLPALRELVESGLTDAAVDALGYNVTLFDFEVILEILDHPSEVIHYFLRRGELEKGEFLIGEEADLLGFYLQTGFNFGEAEFSREHRMRTSGLSDPIDVYYYSVEGGLDVEKPRVERIKWWEELLSKWRIEGCRGGPSLDSRFAMSQPRTKRSSGRPCISCGEHR